MTGYEAWTVRSKEDSRGSSYWVMRYNPQAENSFLGNEYVTTNNGKRKRFNKRKNAQAIADKLNTI